MNERLKNYATNPDPEVWEGIQKTMRRRALRRQALSAAAGVAVVALAVTGVLLWPEGNVVEMQQSPLPDVAQVVAPEGGSVAEEQMLNVSDASQTKATASETKKDSRPNVVNAVATPVVEPAVSTPNVQPVTATQTVVAPMAGVAVAEVAQEGAPAIDEPQISTSEIVNTTPAQSQAKTAINYGNEDTILWVPNIFVPGSDDADINLFRVRLNHPGDVLTNYRITIFSRAGNQVYMSNDMNSAWDGTFRGRQLPQSTYVYIIYYTDKDGFRHQRKGTVTLVR